MYLYIWEHYHSDPKNKVDFIIEEEVQIEQDEISNRLSELENIFASDTGYTDSSSDKEEQKEEQKELLDQEDNSINELLAVDQKKDEDGLSEEIETKTVDAGADRVSNKTSLAIKILAAGGLSFLIAIIVGVNCSLKID